MSPNDYPDDIELGLEPEPEPDPAGRPQGEADLDPCAIARGDVAGPQEPVGTATVAYKDYSARGARRAHWYRMRWTPHARTWAYLGRRLAAGNVRASERHDRVRAEVYLGDLFVLHEHGGPVVEAHLVTGTSEDDGRTIVELAECSVARRRDGDLAITLPDSSVVVAPNPRAR